MKDFNKPRYYITIKGQEPVEITEADFISAERSQGFRPKYGDGVATGGFSGGPMVNYSVRYDDLPIQE